MHTRFRVLIRREARGNISKPLQGRKIGIGASTTGSTTRSCCCLAGSSAKNPSPLTHAMHTYIFFFFYSGGWNFFVGKFAENTVFFSNVFG